MNYEPPSNKLSLRLFFFVAKRSMASRQQIYLLQLQAGVNKQTWSPVLLHHRAFANEQDEMVTSHLVINVRFVKFWYIEVGLLLVSYKLI